MDEMSITTWAGIVGLTVGFGFGALTQATNFCAMGAVADAVSFGDYRRMRAWLLAVAVAIVGAQGLNQSGSIDLSDSIYLSSNLNWVGAILGGLIFGFGMMLASGCPGRNLVRVGGGDLKALVVLIIIGIVGYATLRGIIALVRVGIENTTALDTTALGIRDHGLDTILSALTGLGQEGATLVIACLLVAVLLWYCLKDAGFRNSRKDVIAGLGIGGLVIAGWWGTGVFLADEFDPQPLTSLTFVGPAGNMLQFLMTYTGSAISFGIATVFGVILGAFVAALVRGRFAISGFSDNTDTIRHFAGATMMGFGGIMALGCTIGQSITGVSTLALGSLLAFGAIVAGGIIGMKYLERAIGI